MPRNVHTRPDTLHNACVLQSAYEYHKYNDTQLLPYNQLCCEHWPAAVPWYIFATSLSFARCFATHFFNAVCVSFILWIALACLLFTPFFVH